MKHKHAELIKMWLDGGVVEYNNGLTQHWWPVTSLECFNRDCTFRIKPEPKPEPKPDYIRYFVYNKYHETFYLVSWTLERRTTGTQGDLLATFDGETDELKSAEVSK